MLLEPPHDENRILDLPWEGSDTSFARIRFTALLCFTLPLVGSFAFTMFLNRFRCLFHFNPACVRTELGCCFLFVCLSCVPETGVCVCVWVCNALLSPLCFTCCPGNPKTPPCHAIGSAQPNELPAASSASQSRNGTDHMTMCATPTHRHLQSILCLHVRSCSVILKCVIVVCIIFQSF